MIAATVSKLASVKRDDGKIARAPITDLDATALPGDVDTIAFRAGQIDSVLRHVPYLIFGNLASAAVLLWLSWHMPQRSAFQVWAAVIVGLSAWVFGYWLTRRRWIGAAGAEAVSMVEFCACLFGFAWACLPAVLFSTATPELGIVMFATTLAAAANGTLALARVPSAATIFTGIICGALAVTALKIDNDSGPVLSVMTIIFLTVSICIVLSIHRTAVDRAIDLVEIDRQRDIISLLLKDFERDASDWLWETDPQGRLVHASDRFCVITKRTRAALDGQILRAIAGAAPDAPGWAEFADAMAQRAPIHTLEVSAAGDAGGRWWQLTARPRYDAEGEFLGYRGVGRDISDERRARELLVAAKEEAERSSEAKSRFLAVISHELKTPLHSIVGFSEIMAEAREGPIGTPIYAEYAAMIHTSSVHLRDLINDMLDISRIENGTLRIVDREVDAAELVEIALKMCSSAARSARVTLIFSSPPSAQIRGDVTRIQQVLVNLVSNAVKFSRPDTAVEIEIDRGGDDGLNVVVRDSGIGISQRDMARIFEPFVQADGTIARRFGGMGLGLAISRKIARLHDGDVTLESTQAVGTTAIFSLPPARVTWAKTRA